MSCHAVQSHGGNNPVAIHLRKLQHTGSLSAHVTRPNIRHQDARSKLLLSNITWFLFTGPPVPVTAFVPVTCVLDECSQPCGGASIYLFVSRPTHASRV
eukprot:5547836-Pyramimonas_sp.AAC.1